jgi:tRNA(Ile)-lysidine synthase
MSVLADILLDRVAEIITRYNMASPGDRLGVGVSGGADSVALLHILHILSEQFEITLLVLHLNHQLRGFESDGDERFVRELCESLRVPSLIERTRLTVSSNLEEAARLARRDLYARAMRECCLKRIALGHTRSDQAETVLFRFLRGTGTAGLAGMRMITQDGLIRPLLKSTRSELREWAKLRGIQWREDSSNYNLALSRNRLRQDVMPTLTQGFNSNLEEVLARSAEMAQDEEDYWRDQIESIFHQMAEKNHFGLIIDVGALADLHIAVQRRVIRRALFEVQGNLRNIDIRHVDAIRGICSSKHGHDRVLVPGIDALRSYGRLRLSEAGKSELPARKYRLPLTVGEMCRLPFQAGHISLQRVERGGSFCASVKEGQNFAAEIAVLDGDALTCRGVLKPLSVRSWEPGDAFQRSGHTGPEKVKSLFQEYRILLWERRHWPVVVCGDEIVWVRNFGTAAKFGGTAVSPNLVWLAYLPSPREIPAT